MLDDQEEEGWIFSETEWANDSLPLSKYIYMALLDLGRFFSFLFVYTDARTPRMPQVGSEFTIPVFQRAKTVHALDRAATVIGPWSTWYIKNLCSLCKLHSTAWYTPRFHYRNNKRRHLQITKFVVMSFPKQLAYKLSDTTWALSDTRERRVYQR
jgi:hypothetical protein